MVVIPLQPALVSARALSTTSRRTVVTSRLSLMRRLDSLSWERRSRSASFSALNSSAGFNSPPWLDGGRHRPASSRNRLDAATGFEPDTGLAGTDRIVWSENHKTVAINSINVTLPPHT